ncbi:GPW/gp25 family protein [uncultured Maribacter sp.]|uniref:GPW/gp25 family protein n=1 Tax=uncultured Maribacter sp. TaxID=431308 RepID=UPI002631E5B6|nr:GPW/gp25 family protein [uncultured Maribacter sp.]
MKLNYYSLPLNTNRMISGKKTEKILLGESVAQHLHLVMTTSYGECQFDKSYGCALWNIDFNNVTSDSKLKENIADAILKSLKKQEKRLSNIEVVVDVEQEESATDDKKSRIRKLVHITIKGLLTQIDDEFIYYEHFYIGPLSY